MSIEVIGASFGRTGTRSLKQALEMLGYVACYHMVEVFEHPEHLPVWQRATRGERVDWSGVFEGYRAAVDWPAVHSGRTTTTCIPRPRSSSACVTRTAGMTAS